MSNSDKQIALYQEVEHGSYNLQEVYALAQNDMDYFAALALPLITEYDFPPIYKTIWALLIDYAMRHRDFSKIAVGFPRGFAKTSVVKLAILYFIIFTNKTHIAVICSTATHAQNIISDIADMLDEDNIKAVFGDWRVGLTKDTQEQKRFGFKGRNIVLSAVGQGGTMRGLNIKHQRPDVMVFDDIQTREDADSSEVSDKIKQWMLGTAMKAASHKGCLYIFLANMYPTPHSILRNLKTNPEWIKFIVGGILADGTSLWEDLKPLKQLLAEYRNDYQSGHKEIFLAEVLNDENASCNSTIDINNIPPYPYDDDEIACGSFVVIDPSNDKANSDAVTIALFIIIDGRPVCRKIIDERLSPLDTIKKAVMLAIEGRTGLIVVESNAYQYSLNFWFDHFIKLAGITDMRAVPIYSGARSKNSRILDMFKSLLTGELPIHRDAWAQVTHQVVNFNPLKTNNVDGILDCLTYAPRVLTEMPNLITIYDPYGSMASLPQVLGIEDNCCF